MMKCTFMMYSQQSFPLGHAVLYVRTAVVQYYNFVVRMYVRTTVLYYYVVLQSNPDKWNSDKRNTRISGTISWEQNLINSTILRSDKRNTRLSGYFSVSP